MDTKFISLANTSHQQTIQWRRHFHRIPELGFEEHKTAAFIAEALGGMDGMVVATGCGGTGVVGLLTGSIPVQENQKMPCIALRADMDGLPVLERLTDDNKEYCSTHQTRMHACGHDGHMAILLTTAKLLSENRNFKGTVKFVFQPAEEGGGGAKKMIEDGVLEETKQFGPHVDEIFGLHLWNYLAPNEVGIKLGPLMANSDSFRTEIKGLGGHGAVPQGTKDAIVAAANWVTQVQTIVSRNVAPLESAVVTVGTINGGWKSNIICDSVILTGTCRTFLKRNKTILKNRLTKISQGIAASFDVEVDFKFINGYPATVNASEPHFNRVRDAAVAFVGEDNVKSLPGTMCAEDFSYFLEERPGCFFFLGSAPDPENIGAHPHHKSSFDLNEEVFPTGVAMFLRLVHDFLGVEPAQEAE